MNDKKSILIVDDDNIILKINNKIFATNFPGYEIIFANDGKDALSKFLSLKNNLSLIVTDYDMPEMNGEEFIEVVRKDNVGRQIPVILCSATLGLVKNNNLFNKRFEKPIETKDLLGTANELIMNYESNK